jgi:hypothetical protein
MVKPSPVKVKKENRKKNVAKNCLNGGKRYIFRNGKNILEIEMTVKTCLTTPWDQKV